MNKDRPESANEIEIAITPIELLRACASGSNESLCGCGRKARYETSNGMACNKYFRCMTYEEQSQLLRKLTNAIMQADATIEKLRELRKVTPEMLSRPFDI